MSWPPEQTRDEDVHWKLQVQRKPGEWWSNHTGGLYHREDADALLAEKRQASPEQQWRLVRVTTTYTLERP